MTKCIQCGLNADTLDAVLMTPDGDFCCSDECAEKYRKEQEYFFNEVIVDDNKFENWMRG